MLNPMVGITNIKIPKIIVIKPIIIRIALKKHITPVDVTFYVHKGEGVVEIGKEREAIKKDQLIFSPAKIPHRLLNEFEQTFRFLVIKTPTPTSETKIL